MKPARLLPLLLPLLAACTPPPLLSLADRQCSTAPLLTAGHAVDLGHASGTTVIVDATSPCITTPKGPATYAVFKLPAVDSAYQLTIRSNPRGNGLLMPDAAIYGVDDRVRRAIADFRGAAGAMVASARAEPGDGYLVVTSSPATIGRIQTIPTADNPYPVRITAAVFVPLILPAAPIGPTSSALAPTLAHSGVVTVSAMPYLTLP